VFDQGTNQFLVLGATILAWQKGIPLLKRGGEIKLYIPPSLGYGYTDLVDRNTNAVIIPANSTLLFDVKLLDYTMGF